MPSVRVRRSRTHKVPEQGASLAWLCRQRRTQRWAAAAAAATAAAEAARLATRAPEGNTPRPTALAVRAEGPSWLETVAGLTVAVLVGLALLELVK